MNLEEIGWEVVDQINLTWDKDKWWAVVNVVMSF